MKRFLWHFAEMVVAMVVGMLVLGPVWHWFTGPLPPDLGALVMATNMTIGMSAWMAFRGHGWGAVAEMGLAMYLPFVVLLVPYWTGLISGGTLMMLGHVLMVPAMLLAMLRRREEYSTHHRSLKRTS